MLFPSLNIHQGMDFYEDYAVFVAPKGTVLSCAIFDIHSGKLIVSLPLPYIGYIIPHANVVCFGKFYYSSTSILPILYVSSWNYGRQAFVYDISKDGDNYYAELIQVIDPRKLNMTIVGEGYMDWVIDSDNNFLYSISYHLKETSTTEKNNYTHVTKYKLPDLTEKVVYVEDDDILDYFFVPVMTVFQDKAFYKNHIYVVAGVTSNGDLHPPRFFDIDLNTKILKESRIPLNGEPEGFCVYNGTKWLNMNDSTIVYNLDKMLDY